MNPLYENMKVSVFERMSLAAAKHGAVNLGQGFPDFGWPDEILEEAARALREGSNQYPPSRGLLLLRQAIADHYGRHFGQHLEPDQICVTSGATEALGAMILSVVEPGDEVIIFTPAYDSYAPMIRRAGGKVREVTLEPPAWWLEPDALRAAGTADLTVRFRRPVPLGVPLVVTGELGEVGGRRSTAIARIVAADDPGTTLAEGEATLVALRPERAADVFGATGRTVGAWKARQPGD